MVSKLVIKAHAYRAMPGAYTDPKQSRLADDMVTAMRSLRIRKSGVVLLSESTMRTSPKAAQYIPKIQQSTDMATRPCSVMKQSSPMDSLKGPTGMGKRRIESETQAILFVRADTHGGNGKDLRKIF
jgi:hypothetical protein